ncbi:protein eyes shut homolog [Oncorhynchus mykiss]|uniref:protein eyes shut homolog n=1 Tax=Oncorhynchus mykiss TaxID=8022 RepID=UPI001878C7CE|nr:protein eyes shut homolog [Oncorhynchus mykiss]
MGFHCETNFDECMSGPCLHGRCIDGVDVYYCQCELGWTGARCEMNIDECSSSPCLNGGSCVDLIDKYACFCLDGYTGKNCDIDIDVCLETPTNVTLCLNGGTCLDGQGSNFTCSCPAGFIGDFCEMDVNECCSDPCLHGAICRDLLNGYLCHCRAGWTGLHCELDINECLPQPCNQGMCIQNEPGYGYTCFCRPGFVGRNCEHNYDDCLLQPCPGGSSCVDGINEVSCQPVEGDMSSVPWEPSMTQTPQGSLLTTSPMSPVSPRLKKFGLPPQVLSKYCRCTIESVLTGCIMAWYGNCSIYNRKAIQRVVKMAQYITGTVALRRVGKTAQYITGTLALRRVLKTAQYITGTVALRRTAQYITGTVALRRVVKTAQYITGTVALPRVGKTAQYITGTVALRRVGKMAQVLVLFLSREKEDSSYVQYSGNSYLEFEGIDLGANNNITVRFQTQEAQGTILYVDQGAVTRGFFFMKLFIQEGMLQYVFSCNREEGIRRINTSIRVDDGNPYIVYVRQQLAPCEAEVVVSGYERVRSQPSNYWSGLTIQRTSHLFIGGLPRRYLPYQGAQPFSNYTGCVEIIEMNKLRGFYTSSAVAGSNVDDCR